MNPTPQSSGLHLTDVVLPLFEGSVGSDGTVQADAFLGTGFVPVRNVLVTCWHCVRDAESQLFAGHVQSNGSLKALPLTSVSQSPLGLDLATATVDYESPQPYDLFPERVPAGLEVWSVGYPLAPRIPRPAEPVPGRYLQGYVTRTFPNSNHTGFVAQPTYELDMPTPAGASGSPLLLKTLMGVGGLRLVGVVYGGHDVYSIAQEAEIDPATGVAVSPEVRRYVSFGWALTVECLRSLSGEATDGRRLGDLLPFPAEGRSAER